MLEQKKLHKNTLKGSRTPAACLEGKHDNRFTISVLSLWPFYGIYLRLVGIIKLYSDGFFEWPVTRSLANSLTQPCNILAKLPSVSPKTTPKGTQTLKQRSVLPPRTIHGAPRAHRWTTSLRWLTTSWVSSVIAFCLSFSPDFIEVTL